MFACIHSRYPFSPGTIRPNQSVNDDNLHLVAENVDDDEAEDGASLELNSGVASACFDGGITIAQVNAAANAMQANKPRTVIHIVVRNAETIIANKTNPLGARDASG